MSDEKRRKCEVKGCTAKTKSNRSHWCFPHYKARRKKQLKANNVVWRKRVKQGKAGHHVRYRVHATEWALKHKAAAIAQAKKYKIEAQAAEALKILAKEAGKAALPKKSPKKKASGTVVLKRKEKTPKKVAAPKAVKTAAPKAKPPTVRKAKVIVPVTVSVEATATPETVASA